MSIKKRINKHRQWANKALENNEETRNSDWDLLFEVLKDNKIYLAGWQKKQIKKSGVNIHTLVRERRRIQTTNPLLIPTNPEVAKKRRLLAADYAEHYSNN